MASRKEEKALHDIQNALAVDNGKLALKLATQALKKSAKSLPLAVAKARALAALGRCVAVCWRGGVWIGRW